MRFQKFLAACAALTVLFCASTLEAGTRRSPSHTRTTKTKAIRAAAKHGSRTSSKTMRAGGKSRHGRRARHFSSRRAAPGPYRQQAPTSDRYAEIQKALAARGYFTGNANGEWGADSVDALKRFQADQNLAPDGKINSLALIALGLGPSREAAGDVASRPATEPPATP